MGTKITKGEWIYDCDAKGWSVFTKYDLICRTENKPTIKEAESNAKLISAAPDLLEALQVLISILPVGLKNGILSEEYEKAKQAIKKATE